MRAQSQAASPWPEVPLSPKTPPAPSLAPEWHVLDVRASRSTSIPEDERSEDGGGGNAGGFEAPVSSGCRVPQTLAALVNIAC